MNLLKTESIPERFTKMSTEVANIDYVKEKNIGAVFKAIVEHGPISRIQIARHCSLAAGSITRIIRQLRQSGLVREVEQQDSDRGRKATSLQPAEGKIQILAARAGRTHFHIGLCDLSEKLLANYSEPIQASTQDELGEQLVNTMTLFLQNQQKKVKKLVGIGITVPGLVDAGQGVIHFMPHIPVKDFRLGEKVSRAFGLPCYLGNYTSAMALAEYQMGATKNCLNSFYVAVHNGLGAGMILDGRLYDGANSAVGEIGHIQIDSLGKLCYCGNYGCLETVVSNPAIEAKVQKLLTSGVVSKLPRDADINQICHFANKGDPLARDVLREAAASLGKVIAISINLLRPEKVVLAGEICNAWTVVKPVVEHCIKSQTVNINETDIPPAVVAAELNNSPWYSGYALVRRALLEEGLLWQYMKASH